MNGEQSLSNTEYYEILRRGLPEDLRVERFVHGVAWTAAVLSDGRCGVAMRTEGSAAPRLFDSLLGRRLPDAGEALLSWNMTEAAEALAAVNACYNSRACGFVLPDSKTLDGIDLRGRTVGMIGMMIGHGNMTAEDFSAVKALYVMDREEKPGDYPDSACEYLLPECDLVVVTGSAAINKTMPRILELSRNAEIVLTGPSVSLCPALLEAFPIRRLNGQAIVEPEAMGKTIVEKRCSVNAFSRHYTLDKT